MLRSHHCHRVLRLLGIALTPADSTRPSMTLLCGMLHSSAAKQLSLLCRPVPCSFTAPLFEGNSRLACSATASTSSPSLASADRSIEQKGSQQREWTSKQAQSVQGRGEPSSKAVQLAKKGRLTGNVSGKKPVQQQKPAEAPVEAVPDPLSGREAFQKPRSPHAAMRDFQQANPLPRQQGAHLNASRAQLRAQHTAAAMQSKPEKASRKPQPSIAQRDMESEAGTVAHAQQDALTNTAPQTLESAEQAGDIGPTQVNYLLLNSS